MTRGPDPAVGAPARELGLWSATGLVVGHAIGVGIFLTPADLIGALASPALTIGLWILCGAIVLAGAWTFGELASRFPHAGGPYIYLREAWGERVAFLLGVMTAFKLVALAGVVVIAFAVGDGQWPNFETAAGGRLGLPPLSEALALGLVSVFFSFAGFWSMAETKGTGDRPIPEWKSASGRATLVRGARHRQTRPQKIKRYLDKP